MSNSRPTSGKPSQVSEPGKAPPVPTNSNQLTGPVAGVVVPRSTSKKVEAPKRKDAAAAVQPSQGVSEQQGKPKSSTREVKAAGEGVETKGGVTESKKSCSPWTGNHEQLKAVVGGTTRVVATDDKNSATPVKQKKKKNVFSDPSLNQLQPQNLLLRSSSTSRSPGSAGNSPGSSNGTKLRVEAKDFTPTPSPQKVEQQSAGRGGVGPVVVAVRAGVSRGLVGGIIPVLAKTRPSPPHPTRILPRRLESHLSSPTPSNATTSASTTTASLSIAPYDAKSNLAPKALRKLMVNYVSMKVKADEFKEIFEAYGKVANATLMTHERTGQSRGFGFVEFWSPYSAMSAIQELNGSQYKDKKLKVQYADHQGATVANPFIATNPKLVLLGVGMYASGPPPFEESNSEEFAGGGQHSYDQQHGGDSYSGWEQQQQQQYRHHPMGGGARDVHYYGPQYYQQQQHQHGQDHQAAEPYRSSAPPPAAGVEALIASQPNDNNGKPTRRPGGRKVEGGSQSEEK